MQVSVEATGTLKREMKVEVPEERIAAQVQQRLQSLSKTTKLDGFRPGKIPFKVIENRFGKQVRMEVVSDVVQSSFYEAVHQENLKPAGAPQIDPPDTGQGDGLSYTARFEVLPDVTVAAVDDLEVKKAVCEVSEEDYMKMVEVLRKQHQTWEAVDRGAREGDKLQIDFAGKIDGEPFEGGTASDFTLELGQSRFIDGFETGLYGKQAGDEVVLDLTFPDDYGKAELAGKPVIFEVKIKQILEPVLPPLDDEFFARFGVKEGGEEAFREQVMDHMRREVAAAARSRQRDAVMDALNKANPLELPESLVHEEAHRLQHQFEERLKSYGIDAKNNSGLQSDIAMFEEQAKKRVALQLIVMEIIRKQELKADPAKVRSLVESHAASYEDPATVINWYYGDKNRLADIEAMVLEDEVIDWVCKTAKTKEVKVTFDELMNKRQTDAGS